MVWEIIMYIWISFRSLKWSAGVLNKYSQISLIRIPVIRMSPTFEQIQSHRESEAQ